MPPETITPGSGRIIAMGASTGGTEALAKLFHLLPNLPERLPGIVVVQHMPPGFTQMYAERLNRELPFFDVKEAFDDEIIHSNTIRIAPGDSHLRIKRRDGYFATSVGGDNKVNGHCPSVDVLFDSVAAVAGKLATGVILTGMGADGARGLLRMRNAGAYTFGQDEESCVVYGMPWKAYEFGAVVRQAPLTDIPALLVAHLRGT